MAQTSDSLPAHPSITFEVDLELNMTEAIGPHTNLVNPHILHPDRHQNDQDNAVTEKDNRKNNRSAYIGVDSVTLGTLSSGLLELEHRQLKHGDQFTLKGLKALEIRDKFALDYASDPEMVILKVVS